MRSELEKHVLESSGLEGGKQAGGSVNAGKGARLAGKRGRDEQHGLQCPCHSLGGPLPAQGGLQLRERGARDPGECGMWTASGDSLGVGGAA